MSVACDLKGLAGHRHSLMALDLGTRRTGVAVANPPEWVALPCTTLEAHTFAALLDPLLRLLEERACGALVLGLPLLADGQRGTQVLWAEKFARFFTWRSKIPLFWQDERYTSEAAADGARALGLRAANRYNGKDATEASLILSDFIVAQQER